MDYQLSQLTNGLSILSYSMANIESLALGIWVKCGSRNEEVREHGLAHLLEHMAFKGTKKRSAFEIASAIENVGGEINAATSVETTSYFIRLLAKDTPLGLDILGDILQNSLFDKEELLREKQVVLQEISSAHDAPDDIIFDHFSKTAFLDQPIGRPILGTSDSIKALSADDLRHFLQRQYIPDNMLLIATGCVKHDALCKEAEQLLGHFKNPSQSPPLAKASYIGGEYREKRDLLDTHLILGFEGFPYQQEDFYAAQLLSIILGSTMSSRLFQEVREKRGLCYSIYSFHWGFSDTGLFGIHTSASPENLNDLLHVIVKELHKAIDLITREEIERAIAQYRASLIMAKETPIGAAQMVARQYLLTKGIKSFKEIFAILHSLTPENIQETAKKIFLTKKPTLIAIGNVEALMPYQSLQNLLAR